MGHRALVAYRRPDYLYDLRYSHWGGANLRLVDAITSEAPLARGFVDTDLVAVTVALDRVLTGYLDPRRYEALYLVSPAFEVTPYRVWWLGWDGDDVSRGAVVETAPGERDRTLRAWFRATKTVLADVVEMDVLSRRAARSYLESRACEERDGYPYAFDGHDESIHGPADDDVSP